MTLKLKFVGGKTPMRLNDRYVSPLLNRSPLHTPPNTLLTASVSLKKRIEALERKVKQLRNAVRIFRGEPAEDPDREDAPAALWDGADKIDRCTECAVEVVHGFCQGCGTEFAYDSVRRRLLSLE